MTVYIRFANAPYMKPGMYQRVQLVGVFCCTVPSFSLCCGADDHPIVELENKHKVYWWVMRYGYIHIVLDILMCAWWIKESRFLFQHIYAKETLQHLVRDHDPYICQHTSRLRLDFQEDLGLEDSGNNRFIGRTLVLYDKKVPPSTSGVWGLVSCCNFRRKRGSCMKLYG